MYNAVMEIIAECSDDNSKMVKGKLNFKTVVK